MRKLTEALTLVSVVEFERNLKATIDKLASQTSGPLALYATREVPKGERLDFRQGGSGLDAVARGWNTGSEARVAHIVRQMCKTQPGRLLPQPSIEELLERRVDRILLIDDIVASGTRTRNYLDQIWRDASIKSWWSYKKLCFDVVAYAGTVHGLRRVRVHPSKPKLHVHRYCPTIDGLPWQPARRRQAVAVCERYTEIHRLPKGYGLGFGKVGALLVFEHGCPNNVPSIFWANSRDDKTSWQPLFPQKAITTELGSVFPDELVARAPISVLLDAGQKRIAAALRNVIDRPLPEDIVVMLSLLGRGVHRVEALTHATGLTIRQCSAVLETCIEAGLVSPTWRLTELGRAELRGMEGAAGAQPKSAPGLGEDDYYPKSLRVRVAG